jgi:hypothetical protein
MKRKHDATQPFATRDELCAALRATHNQSIVDPYGDVAHWDVSALVDFTYLMRDAQCTEWFDHDVSGWMFGHNMLDVEGMFAGCARYNQPLRWSLSSQLVNLARLFADCPAMTAEVVLENLYIHSAEGMFDHCVSFNAPVVFDVSRPLLPSTACLFRGCVRLNQPLVLRGVREIHTLDSMWEGCVRFNQPIDLSSMRVHRVNRMLADCVAYNHPLVIPGTSLVSCQGMVDECRALQAPIRFVDCAPTFVTPTIYHCPAAIEVFRRTPPMPTAEEVFRDVERQMRRVVMPDIIRPYPAALPWRVHAEQWRGITVYVLDIPRGTVLFTARTQRSATRAQSMLHLWKLTQPPSFTDENLGESLWTYFYPIPYMCEVLDSDFQTLDMVRTTRDFRLLCLVQPASMARSDRHHAQLPQLLYSCPSRDYDLCLQPACMRELRLQGYIGIAGQDSLSQQYRNVGNLSLLTQACAMSHDGQRIAQLGVPEIVLLAPLCIDDLAQLDQQYVAAQTQQPLPCMVPFRSVHQFRAPHTADLLERVEEELNTQDRWMRELAASRQAPCLLFVYVPDTSLDAALYTPIDHIFTPRDYDLDLSYRNVDPAVIVAIHQGGAFSMPQMHRLRGPATHRGGGPRVHPHAITVRRFGCMPIVWKRKHASRSRNSTRKRHMKSL